jgi:hypothetical protein
MTQKIKISEIQKDGGTQTRAEIDNAKVDEYAEQMAAGVKFPPAIVYYDGTAYWMADGFHRTFAAEKAGKNEIECTIRQGTRRDAILCSVGANATHGMPRTNADKRRAVETLLQDDEWAKWSDRNIAEKCAVSSPFVAHVRESICKPFTDAPAPIEPRKVERGGTVYTMNTAAVGKRAAVTPEPSPVRELSRTTTTTVEVVVEPTASSTRATKLINAGKRMSFKFSAAFDAFERQMLLEREISFGGETSIEAATACLRSLSAILEFKEPAEATPRPEVRGVGLDWGYKAIEMLQKIPSDDGLRNEAFDLVSRWCNHNRKEIIRALRRAGKRVGVGSGVQA